MTRVYLFPGQGSQKVGMGADLFPRFPDQVAMAERELGYDLAELCLRDSQGRLNSTLYTQPALYFVNALTFLARVVDTGELPHFVAGHSLGEYDALFAAGVFDLHTGLRLVKERATLMARATGGGMAAVIGLSPEKIAVALRSAGLDALDVANFNTPLQTVISGPVPELEQSQRVLEGAGASLWKRLPVSAAFHSRYMVEAERAFATVLRDAPLAAPRIPVLSNVTAALHELASIKELLAKQISHSVRWTESIRWLARQPGVQFTELGPGNVLTGLVRRIQTEDGRTGT